MRALSAAELLEAWERGLDANLTERMLILLGASCTDRNRSELADMPLGGRDALLLELRLLLFGPACTAVVSCPGCGEQLESTFPLVRMRIEDPQPTAVLRLQSGGVSVAFRVPSSNDLLALTGTGGAGRPGSSSPGASWTRGTRMVPRSARRISRQRWWPW